MRMKSLEPLECLSCLNVENEKTFAIIRGVIPAKEMIKPSSCDRHEEIFIRYYKG